VITPSRSARALREATGTLLLAQALLLLGLTLGAPPAGADPDPGEIHDPIEPLNRGIFALNDWLDRWVLEKAAIVWGGLFPHSFHVSLRNVTNNSQGPVVMVNDLLQGKPIDAAEDLGRFVVNTTIGLGGLLDPATALGLEDNAEDFGQTFGVWGIPAGPFLMLPLLGPSNPRDLVGRIADTAWRSALLTFPVTLGLSATDILNRRTLLLETIREERAAAFDLYAAIRNAYVQQRKSQIAEQEDGEQPTEANDDLYYFEEDDATF
jgi:phospholipid-binding lipoprotein MlaA